MSKIPGDAGRTIVTLFDRAYPADLQAEGQAVSWAVVSGACDQCQHLTVCINSDGNTWRPPATASCMARNVEILQKLEDKYDTQEIYQAGHGGRHQPQLRGGPGAVDPVLWQL